MYKPDFESVHGKYRKDKRQITSYSPIIRTKTTRKRHEVRIFALCFIEVSFLRCCHEKRGALIMLWNSKFCNEDDHSIISPVIYNHNFAHFLPADKNTLSFGCENKKIKFSESTRKCSEIIQRERKKARFLCRIDIHVYHSRKPPCVVVFLTLLIQYSSRRRLDT